MQTRDSTTQPAGNRVEPFELEQVDPKRVVARISRHLTGIFFTLATLCYLDRANLAFAASQLREDLDFSASTYGLGAGVFFVGYALFQIPSNLVLVKVGASTWLAGMLIVWGIVAALSAFVKTFPQFLVARVLLGVAECGAFPGMWYHLSLFLDAGELGVAYTGVTTATALSQVLGGPLAAALLLLDGTWGLHGWQWLFLCEGLPTIAFGIMLKVILAPSPAEAACLKPAERVWLQQRQDHAAVSKASAAAHSSTTDGLLNWRVWYLGFIWFLMECAIFGIIFWCPQLIEAGFYGVSSSSVNAATKEESSIQDSKVALLSAAVFGPAAAAMLLNAYLSKRAGERHWHGCLPVFASGFCFGLMPLAEAVAGFRASFILLIFAAAGTYAVQGPLFSWPATFLQGNAAAAGSALINSMGGVGGFVGPTLIGYLVDDNDADDYDAAMLAVGICVMCGAVLMLGFPEPETEASGKSHQALQATKFTDSEQELEKQPMLQPIPWEPHFSDFHLHSVDAEQQRQPHSPLSV